MLRLKNKTTFTAVQRLCLKLSVLHVLQPLRLLFCHISNNNNSNSFPRILQVFSLVVNNWTMIKMMKPVSNVREQKARGCKSVKVSISGKFRDKASGCCRCHSAALMPHHHSSLRPAGERRGRLMIAGYFAS